MFRGYGDFESVIAFRKSIGGEYGDVRLPLVVCDTGGGVDDGAVYGEDDVRGRVIHIGVDGDFRDDGDLGP